MTITATDNADVVEVTSNPVRLTVDQMAESLAAEAAELDRVIRENDDEIKRLQRENSTQRARRRTVKRLLTAVKPRDRKTPVKTPVKKAAK